VVTVVVRDDEALDIRQLEVQLTKGFYQEISSDIENLAGVDQQHVPTALHDVDVDRPKAVVGSGNGTR